MKVSRLDAKTAATLLVQGLVATWILRQQNEERIMSRSEMEPDNKQSAHREYEMEEGQAVVDFAVAAGFYSCYHTCVVAHKAVKLPLKHTTVVEERYTGLLHTCIGLLYLYFGRSIALLIVTLLAFSFLDVEGVGPVRACSFVFTKHIK